MKSISLPCNFKNGIFLIDSSSYFYRAFYALPPLANSKGFPTGATLGYTRMLMKLMADFDIKYGACLFDSHKSLRKESFKEYKANRKAMPDELLQQVDYIAAISGLLGFKTFRLEGYEADDLIAYVVNHLQPSIDKPYKNSICIVTSDKDLKQLLSENVCIYDARKNEVVTAESFESEFGIKPDQYKYILALMGDASDNIPGIKGIGGKTALNLIKSYKNLDGIYENIDSVSQIKTKELLIKHREDAYASLSLASFYNDLPFEESYFVPANHHHIMKGSQDLQDNPLPGRTQGTRDDSQAGAEPLNLNFKNLDDFSLKEKNINGLIDIFKELEFSSLVKILKAGEKPKGDLLFFQNGENLTNNIPRQNAAENAPINSSKNSNKYEPHNDLNNDELCIYIDFNQKNKLLKDSFDFTAGQPNIIYLFSKKTGTLSFSSEDICKNQSIELLLYDETFKKIGFDLNGMRKYFKSIGYDLKNLYFDLQIASYLLNPVRHSHNFTDVYNEYYEFNEPASGQLLNKQAFDSTALSGFNSAQRFTNSDKLDSNIIDYDPQNKAFIAYKLYRIILSEIEQDSDLKRLFFEVDMPLSHVLADIEDTGFMADKGRLISLSSEFDLEAKKLAGIIYKIAGEEFNINSPKQLSEVMFEKLKFKRVKKNSTDNNVLMTLKSEIELLVSINKSEAGFSESQIYEQTLSNENDPVSADTLSADTFKEYLLFIDSIISYRNKIKLRTSFTDVLISKLDQNDRVHTSFSQIKTSTGRLSSYEPNLQNIPVAGIEGKKIRQSFIAPEGKLLVCADYSQIDLRVMASVSGDQSLIESFKNGEDIHSITASEIFNAVPSNIDQDMRRRAKVVNFGIIYGMSPYGLSKELNISQEEAKLYIDLFFKNHPSIKKYMEETVKNAKKNGYVKTAFGRKCYIKGIDSNPKLKNLVSFAERAAINAPIQGTASDIIKIAMVNIHKELKEKNVKAKMILQVHDELIFEADRQAVDELSTARQQLFGPVTNSPSGWSLLKIIELKMTDENLLKDVPLVINTGVGKNWDEAHQ